MWDIAIYLRHTAPCSKITDVRFTALSHIYRPIHTAQTNANKLVCWSLLDQRFTRWRWLVCLFSTTTSVQPIKWMRSPHTSYRWREEKVRDNQVYALTTHQLQVERIESHNANQVNALTTHQLQVERRESQRQSSVCSHHTPATGGEDRES